MTVNEALLTVWCEERASWALLMQESFETITEIGNTCVCESSNVGRCERERTKIAYGKGGQKKGEGKKNVGV